MSRQKQCRSFCTDLRPTSSLIPRIPQSNPAGHSQKTPSCKTHRPVADHGLLHYPSNPRRLTLVQSFSPVLAEIIATPVHLAQHLLIIYHRTRPIICNESSLFVLIPTHIVGIRKTAILQDLLNRPVVLLHQLLLWSNCQLLPFHLCPYDLLDQDVDVATL